MNKLLQKVAKLTLGLAMAAGVGVAVSGGVKESAPVEAAAGDTYERISSASDLSAGDYIVFVNQAETYACGTTQNTNNRTPVRVSISNHAFTKGESDNIQEFKLVAGATSGQYGLHTGSGYYKSNSSSKNNTTTDSVAESTTPSGTQLWTFSVSNYVFSVTNVSNTNYYLAFNSTTYFSQYKQGQSKPYIYKKAASHTITFNANGGSGSVPSNITGSGSKTLPSSAPNLSKTGYTLDGWSDSSHKDDTSAQYALGASYTLNDDITLYAHWTANKYDISYYDQGGGTFSGSHESGYPTKHTYGTETTLKGATKGGHNFDGWFTTSACTGSAVTSLGATSYTDDISLYAKWTATGNTYSITTTVTNGNYSGDTTITDNGGVASVTIAPTGDYKLPASVSVSGADHTYNASTGAISLSNATGNVTISAAMVALTEYSITVNETNGSHTGASVIKESRTATLTFTHDSGYGHPADVTVSGATKNWVRETGVLTLSNPTGNVTVTYAAVGNELDSITLSANSGAYTLGEVFVKPTVTAHYTVAADANVTNSPNLEVTGYNPYTTGTQPVTITYTEDGIEKSASYTATVNAKSVQTITTWEATTLSQLTADDVFVIVGNNGSNYAMTNDNGTTSAPGVAAVTVSNNKLSAAPAANLQWNISGNATDGYTFYPNGSTTTWLYCTATNNGVRVGTNANKTFTISDGGYLVNAGTSRYVGIYSSQDWRCYTSINSNIQNQTFSYFKKVETQVGTASLIRIVCDPAIDPATGYKGGDKFVGDTVYTTDFVVKKQLDTGNELTAITGFTINGGSEVELTSTSNTITVSYTEGGIPKSTEVVVAATERAAELESVQLVEKGEVRKSGYIDFASATWNLDNIYVHYYWSDDEFDTEVTLASLVATDDATISPIKPTVDATSFTVSYEYLEVQITNNTITLTEAVRTDYVASMSWGNTTAAHFKHFSGEQLTEEIVNTWHVKATYAGAGEGSRLYWGDYDLYIGNKQITSLPYTWLSEDDGQALSIHYGEDVDGNEFVKTNDTAVGNICATINAIDHDETATGLLDKTATWTKEQSAEIYDGGSNLTELCDNGVDIDTNIHMQGDSTAGSTAIRFWGDGIRCYNGNKLTFTPKNGAVITKITFASTGISFDDGVTDSSSSPFTINDGYGDSAITLSFALSSTVKMGSDVVVEYQIEGSETTTVHYANQMKHFDAQKKVVEFAKFMNTTMNGSNVCSGTFANLEDAWDDVAGKYDELFGASTTLNTTELAWAKKMLEYATAAWGSDAELACVEKAMKTYEHCTSKYELTPFMDGVRSAGAKQVSPLMNVIGENSNTIAIIVIISMVSMTTIGAFFFIRKRKENI